jgi:ABC-type phosphate/phosphonate transport system substrate-binding protein
VRPGGGARRAAPALLACALGLATRGMPAAEPSRPGPTSPPLVESIRPGGPDKVRLPLPSFNLGFYGAVLAEADLKDAKAAVKVWADMIMRRRKQAVESKAEIFESLAAMEAGLRAGRVDFVWFLPNDFIETRDRLPVVPIVVATPVRGEFDELYLLVRKDSGAKTIRDLRHKRIVVEMEHDGSLPMIWLETLLMREGAAERPARFFGSIRSTAKSSQVVLAVFFGQADACIASRNTIETMAELNPQVGKELGRIASSPPYATAVGCLRTDFYDRYESQIMDAMELLHSDPQGKQILTLFRRGKLIRFNESLLASVEALLRERDSFRLNVARRP